MLDLQTSVDAKPPAARSSPGPQPAPIAGAVAARPALAAGDPLARLLARAVATRASAAGNGPLLQRTLNASGAAASLRSMFPTHTSVSFQELGTWLKARVNPTGPDRTTNARFYDAKAGDRSAINAELAKLAVVTETKKKNETQTTDDADTGGRAQFPHNGKHRPYNTDHDAIVDETKGGNDAKYFSKDAETVIELEKQALDNGLEVAGDFTTVHRFTEEIGADYGEATRCLRMDGHHHGHPIIETSSETPSFDTYIAKDLAQARFDENLARTAVISDYLVTVGLTVDAYESQIKKHLAPLRKMAQDEAKARKAREDREKKRKAKTTVTATDKTTT
jgi:hypothetical protein